MTPLTPATATADVLESGVSGSPDPAYMGFLKAHRVAILCALGALLALKMMR